MRYACCKQPRVASLLEKNEWSFATASCSLYFISVPWWLHSSRCLGGCIHHLPCAVRAQVSWCRMMESKQETKFWALNGRLVYRCVDIGPTGGVGWGGVGWGWGGRGVCGGVWCVCVWGGGYLVWVSVYLGTNHACTHAPMHPCLQRSLLSAPKNRPPPSSPHNATPALFAPGDFGNPLPEADPSDFHQYVDVVEELEEPRFDVVLVDGRFRVACALKALW
jgi:hypothetical protein